MKNQNTGGVIIKLLICGIITVGCLLINETANCETYRNDYYSFNCNSEWTIKVSSSQYYPPGVPPYLSLSNPLHTDQKPDFLHWFSGGVIEIYTDYRRPEETVQSLTQRLPVSLSIRDSLKQQKDTKMGFMGTSYTISSKGSAGGDISSQGFWFVREMNGMDIAFDIRLSIYNPQGIDDNTKKKYFTTYNEILKSFKFLK